MTEQHTGGMIALVPADPDALAVDGGDPADQLHLTLAYLGDDVSSMSDATREALKASVATFAQDVPTIQGKIMAHAVYNPDGEEFDPATVYQLQHHDHLGQAADYARNIAQRAMGADFPEQHPGFLPHVTAGYGVDPGKLSATGPVAFDRVRLALGGENHDFPLRKQPFGDEVAPSGMFAVTTSDAPAEVPVPDLDETNGVPLNFPVIIVEGMETSDGRYIEPGSLTHRALPLPILAQTANPVGGQGHDGAEVVGRLDVLERVPGPEVENKETGEPFPEGTFVWRGSGFGDPESKGVQLAEKRYLTGNSADLVNITAAVDELASQQRIVLSSGEIAATTLVPIPAFAQAYVEVGGAALTPNEDALTAAAVPAWRSSELGDDCALCAAAHQARQERALTAAGGAPLPPADAFADPGLTELTPLTLDDTSIPGLIEVYGHLAGWNVCHTGFSGTCVLAPRSRADYGYFHVGAVRTAEGMEVAAGHITMGEGGHAGAKLSAAETAKFYDNVNTVVADVAAGEDKFGVWVHGVVRPTATPEQVAALRAAPLSGDWRHIGGGLELVAALAVNTPGFPIPRARVASGVPVSLVAAGVVPVPDREAAPTGFSGTLVDVGVLASAVADEMEARAAMKSELANRSDAALSSLGMDWATRYEVARYALFGEELSARAEVAAWSILFGADADTLEFAKKKGGNWVEKAGGLPKYIKRITKHLQEKGMDESRAIATAVNAAKKMCSTGDVNFPGKQQVNPGSKAEACAAVAEWEKKKAAS